jgi:hypothetical protein
MPPHIHELMEAEVRNNPRRLVTVIDYLLVTTYNHGGRTPAGFAGPVQLPADIRIERLDPDLAERLLRATDLRGENWSPTRQYHVVHAYVRTAWQEADGEAPDRLHHWDADGRLYPCVQLSRLVRDNATSTERAVRRLINADGSERLVPFDGFDSHVAYRLYPERPGWLDVDEAQQLDALARAYWGGPALPERVGRGLRRVESVTRERYLEDALPLVVGGLESLLKVIRDFARAQFAQRVPAVAREVGVTLTEAQCRDLYDDRSALVHGPVSTCPSRTIGARSSRASSTSRRPCAAPSVGRSRTATSPQSSRTTRASPPAGQPS